MAELRVKETGTLKLFESDNTSSVTIASPASLGGDRTITLPDADVTLASGTMATTNGITVADQWRLTANLTVTSGDEFFTTNLEQVDTAGQGTLGSAMTESNGVFTFPSSGIYLVEYGIYTFDNVDTYTYCYNKIFATINNADYTTIAQGTTSQQGTMSGYPEKTAIINSLVDVTNTTNVKVKFAYNSGSTIIIKGDSAVNRTFFTFIRLGDT